MNNTTEKNTTNSVSLGDAEPLQSKPPAKRGRPKKSDIAKKKTGSRGQVGRPKGDAAIMNEYKARMLNSPKSEKVLAAIFDAALNDEHKNQAAAWKLLMDRIAPTALFEKDILKSGGSGGIQINISTVGDTSVSSKDIDGDIVSDQ